MKNLFLFTGEETYLLNEQIRHWKGSFTEKYGDINLTTLDGKQAPAAEMIAQISAWPFLGEKRLIFIENLPEPAPKKEEEGEEKNDDKDPLKPLIEFLPKIPETSVVIFVQPKADKRKSLYKALAKTAEIKEFKPLEGAPLHAWIETRFKERGGAVPPRDVTTHLASLTGPHLFRLSQEIDKLCSYAENGPIDRATVDLLVTPTLEANIFHLTDALGARDHREAIRQLHLSMNAGNNLRQTFYMIVRQFRLFLEIKSYMERHPSATSAEIASKLHLHPFVVRNTEAQARRFENSLLFEAHEKLLKIDADLKTSRIKVTADDQDELALAIERFMIDCCRPTVNSKK